MTYSSLIQKLYQANLMGGIKLGLENPRRLCALFGHPQRQFPSIHVAGTNGKGSVVTKIAASYQYAGAKVGLYTSPHISCFRERIRINGQMISEESVEELLPTIFDKVKISGIPATFFELTTLLAFMYFVKEKVDIAVLETGLGGRLDATNVVLPLITTITSISLDHTDTLGTTIESIAHEKAGIIKPYIPVVIGPKNPHALFKEHAKSCSAPFYQVTGTFPDYLSENNAIARKTLEVLGLPDSIIEAGLVALPSCRLEYHPRFSLIMDVAHNPDGLEKLFSALKLRFPQHTLKVICGLSKSKDLKGCIEVLKKHVNYLALVEANNGRGLPVNEFAALLKQEEFKGKICCFSSIQETVQSALAERESQDLLVACGTFFIMGPIRQALGIVEPTDPVDLNEKVTAIKQ